MTQFLVTLLLFLALHPIPALISIRTLLIGLADPQIHLHAYSVISLQLLDRIFHAAMQLEFVPLRDPAVWQDRVPLVLNPLAIAPLLAGLFSTNPISVALRGPAAELGAATPYHLDHSLWEPTDLPGRPAGRWPACRRRSWRRYLHGLAAVERPRRPIQRRTR